MVFILETIELVSIVIDFRNLKKTETNLNNNYSFSLFLRQI